MQALLPWQSIGLQSIWIGLSIAAPVGPIGLLVIQRTLRHGRAEGLATGFGAAFADAVYGAVGAFGVSALIGALQAARVPLALVGGMFLLWLAWRTWHATGPSAGSSAETRPALWASFAGTFGLTLSNPSTVLSFMAIFGAMSAGEMTTSPWVMVGGVWLGSALWWLTLCGAVGALRERFAEHAQRWVGRASALMLAAFALWQWAALLAGPQARATG
jgi:threonine/homoserine/homoserine lactone efflux protein